MLSNNHVPDYDGTHAVAKPYNMLVLSGLLSTEILNPGTSLYFTQYTFN